MSSYSNSKYTCTDCLEQYGGSSFGAITVHGGHCPCCGYTKAFLAPPSDFGEPFKHNYETEDYRKVRLQLRKEEVIQTREQ